jgi:hypothetical protein
VEERGGKQWALRTAHLLYDIPHYTRCLWLKCGTVKCDSEGVWLCVGSGLHVYTGCPLPKGSSEV